MKCKIPKENDEDRPLIEMCELINAKIGKWAASRKDVASITRNDILGSLEGMHEVSLLRPDIFS